MYSAKKNEVLNRDWIVKKDENRILRTSLVNKPLKSWIEKFNLKSLVI